MPGDEPAAIFFAIAGHARAFPGGWRLMTALFLENLSARGGTKVEVSVDELAALRLDVATRAVGWVEVRDFIHARTHLR